MGHASAPKGRKGSFGTPVFWRARLSKARHVSAGKARDGTMADVVAYMPAPQGAGRRPFASSRQAYGPRFSPEGAGRQLRTPVFGVRGCRKPGTLVPGSRDSLFSAESRRDGTMAVLVAHGPAPAPGPRRRSGVPNEADLMLQPRRGGKTASHARLGVRGCRKPGTSVPGSRDSLFSAESRRDGTMAVLVAHGRLPRWGPGVALGVPNEADLMLEPRRGKKTALHARFLACEAVESPARQCRESKGRHLAEHRISATTR